MLDEQARRLLEGTRFGALATIGADGAPQQTVMWYELVGDRILMNTAAGRVKEANVRRDPRVSLCIEDSYSYVTVRGHAKLNDDPGQAQADIARLARRYHAPEKAASLIEKFRTEQRVTIWMSIDHVITKL